MPETKSSLEQISNVYLVALGQASQLNSENDCPTAPSNGDTKSNVPSSLVTFVGSKVLLSKVLKSISFLASTLTAEATPQETKPNNVATKIAVLNFFII